MHKNPGNCSTFKCAVHEILRNYSIFNCTVHKTPRKYSTFKCAEHKNPGNYSILSAQCTKFLENTAFLSAKSTKTLEIAALLSAQCPKFLEITAFSSAQCTIRLRDFVSHGEIERDLGPYWEIRDDRGKIAHGVDVPEGKILAPVALVGTRCKHGACQEVSKPPRTMPPPWPSLGRRAGAMAWGYASYDDGSAPLVV